MHIDIILCTRNRPSNIRNLISSLNEVDSAELIDVTIVDASDFKNNFLDLTATNIRQIKVLNTAPGLPSQRNLGISVTSNPIVIFLDDDVTVSSNFLTETINAFQGDPSISGLGYLLKGVSIKRPNWLLRKLANMDYSDYGQVARSGKNFWYPEETYEVLHHPMWIPGCAMAFRRGSISTLNFNSNLERGVLGGYALGEDVDFTLRLLSTGGKLSITTKTIVNHYEAPGERDNAVQMAVAQGHWLHFLTKQHPLFVKKYLVALRLISECIYFAISSMTHVEKKRLLVASKKRLRAYFDKNQPLGNP